MAAAIRQRIIEAFEAMPHLAESRYDDAIDPATDASLCRYAIGTERIIGATERDDAADMLPAISERISWILAEKGQVRIKDLQVEIRTPNGARRVEFPLVKEMVSVHFYA